MRERVPDLDASWREMFAGVARTGEPARLVRRTQDGKRWFDAYAARIGDASPPRIAILISNVTDRQFAEGLLRAEKAVLEQIAAGVPLADTLATLCGQVEALSLDGLRCSVSLADAGVYFHQSPEIGAHDRQLCDHATRLAALATEHARAEQAVRESEQRFRGFADTAPAMLAVTEPDASCSFLSRGWYEFTGQTEATGLGFGWLDVVHADDRVASRDTFLAANARRTPFTLEHRVRRADGEYRWVIGNGGRASHRTESSSDTSARSSTSPTASASKRR